MPGAVPGPRSGVRRLAAHHSANAGKMHLQLNLAAPESREVLFDLVRWAHVITESFTPRAMRSMGLSYDVFRQVNPRIIMVSSCLMGQTGPLRDYAGFGTAALPLPVSTRSPAGLTGYRLVPTLRTRTI